MLLYYFCLLLDLVESDSDRTSAELQPLSLTVKPTFPSSIANWLERNETRVVKKRGRSQIYNSDEVSPPARRSKRYRRQTALYPQTDPVAARLKLQSDTIRIGRVVQERAERTRTIPPETEVIFESFADICFLAEAIYDAEFE